MIEWKDKRGRTHIFVLEPLDFGPPPEPLPVHPFEPHRYMNGSEANGWNLAGLRPIPITTLGVLARAWAERGGRHWTRTSDLLHVKQVGGRSTLGLTIAASAKRPLAQHRGWTSAGRPATPSLAVLGGGM